MDKKKLPSSSNQNQNQNKNKNNNNAPLSRSAAKKLDVVLKASPPPKNTAVKVNAASASSAKSEKKEEIIIKPTKKKIKKALLKHIGGKKVKNWLNMIDPWLCAIADPFHVHGVRIPDPDTTPSGTFSIWDHRQIITNAGGMGVIIWGIGYTGTPGDASVGSLVPVQNNLSDSYLVGLTQTGVGVSTTNLFAQPTFVGTVKIDLPAWDSVTATVPTFFSHARLVSFGCRIVFTGNLLNAQGTITMVSVPRNTLRESVFNSTVSLTLEQLQALPGVEIISIPEKFGGMVIYKPTDQLSNVYTDLAKVQIAADGMDEQCLGNEIYIVVSGAVANQAFQIDTCWNFEGIPLSNQFSIVNEQVSKSDPLSYANCSNKVEDLPPALPLNNSPKSATETPQIEDLGSEDTGKLMSDSHPSQDKTLMERLLSGMDDIGKVVGKGAQIAEAVGPFMAALL